MPSAFGHIYAGLMLGKSWRGKALRRKLLWTTLILAPLPDIDAIGFAEGVSYQSMWGHRGITHSIFFAVLLAFAVTYFLFRTEWRSRDRWRYVLYFFLVIMSHGFLDGFTGGHMGVGYFIPFSDARYFFDFRPIKVSPISITGFFTERGLSVLASEAVWVGIPFTVLYVISWLWRLVKRPEPRS